MSSTGRLLILFVVTLFCYFLPDQGEKILPSVFDQIRVHYAFATLTSALAAAGLLLSLRGVLDSHLRAKDGIWPFLAFLIFTALVFTSLGMKFQRYSELREYAAEVTSSAALPGLLNQLYTSDTPDKRLMIASAIFRNHGMKVFYEVEKGRYGFFQPGDADFGEYQKSRVSMQNATRDLMIGSIAIVQVRRIIVIYAAMFLMVFTVGPLCFFFGGRKDSPAK